MRQTYASDELGTRVCWLRGSSALVNVGGADDDCVYRPGCQPGHDTYLECTVIGLSGCTRVGVSTAADQSGSTGQGYWWITGHARPGLVPERTRRPRALRRRFWRRRR